MPYAVKPGEYTLEEYNRLLGKQGTPEPAGDGASPETESKMITRRPRRTSPGTYAELRVLAETYYDVSKFAVAMGNREGAAFRDAVLIPELINNSAEATVSAHFASARKIAEYQLTECYRVTAPEGVIKWQEESKGVGQLLIARLLGVTGHPRLATPVRVTWEKPPEGAAPGQKRVKHREVGETYERSVSQLWQYCGHGAPKRLAGDGPDKQAVLMSNGNPQAKMIVHLLAESQVKSNAKPCTAYRWLYDQVKLDYSDAVHNSDCARCKRKAGEPLRQAHVHANALRIVGKEILRDMWIAAGK